MNVLAVMVASDSEVHVVSVFQHFAAEIDGNDDTDKVNV
jgi:hypothetical protein